MAAPPPPGMEASAAANPARRDTHPTLGATAAGTAAGAYGSMPPPGTRAAPGAADGIPPPAAAGAGAA